MDHESLAGDDRRAAPLMRLLATDPCDEDLVSHSEAVGNLARRIALWMGLPERTAERLRLAGVLHDIGKLVLPREILYKEEQLTEDEWIQIRRHPETGYRLLMEAGLPDLATWVRCHHERPDGRGYPRRLSGGQIPPEAAILAVADSYCAMTGDRLHQAAISDGEALAEVRRCTGSQFAPAAAAALAEVASPAATVAVCA